jgi:hypothetical protein
MASAQNTLFEFRIYPADEDGAMKTADERIEVERFRDVNLARNRAGRLAKNFNGAVDLAYAGHEDWPDRYITTASPSEHHARGFRFERLVS